MMVDEFHLLILSRIKMTQAFHADAYIAWVKALRPTCAPGIIKRGACFLVLRV
jgi:hypothetical protein